MPNEVKESYSNLVNTLCIYNSCSDEYKDVSQRYSVPARRHRPQPFLLKRVRGQLKMSEFPPNCVRFVVYGGVQIINGKR